MREQGVHPTVNVSQVADEKPDTENNVNNNNVDIASLTSSLNKHQKLKLLKEKNEVIINSPNVRILRNFQLHELVTSAEWLLNDVVLCPCPRTPVYT